MEDGWSRSIDTRVACARPTNNQWRTGRDQDSISLDLGLCPNNRNHGNIFFGQFHSLGTHHDGGSSWGGSQSYNTHAHRRLEVSHTHADVHVVAERGNRSAGVVVLKNLLGGPTLSCLTARANLAHPDAVTPTTTGEGKRSGNAGAGSLRDCRYGQNAHENGRDTQQRTSA